MASPQPIYVMSTDYLYHLHPEAHILACAKVQDAQLSKLQE
jgi:hypothetical protein